MVTSPASFSTQTSRSTRCLPAFRDRAPYIIAWIELDEGFRMLSTIVGDEIAIGQRVRVTWEDQENDISLPLFEPA